MQIIKYPQKGEWKFILKRPEIDSSVLNLTVTQVLDEVKNGGDKAVRKFSHKFDNLDIQTFRVTEEEINEGIKNTDTNLKKAIKKASLNIKKFHESQKTENIKIETMPGVHCWSKDMAIEKVGLYIPGGTAPLFSTILMLGIPATIVGCSKIILCTPPSINGKLAPAILYTANLVGLKEFYKIGGIQAIGAMAYGTETVPSVDKIFGPGNRYVTTAKQIVSTHGVAIDMPAGPSEVAIIADEYAIPEFVAADLLSQAEHGYDSQVILATTNNSLIELVETELKKQLNELPRKEIAKKSLENSKIILMQNKEELIDLINEYAPEHLIISSKHEKFYEENIINAGSVFLGNYTPESAGDYASGTNHTLPTNGYAKAFSGLNISDFMKKISFQRISKKGIHNIGNIIEIMAEAEHLHAHKNAVSLRLKNLDS